MELEHVIKRMDFFDEERRKDKATIAALEERLATTEVTLNGFREQLKSFNADWTRFATAAARLEQFDSILGQYRAEIGKTVEEMEKRRDKHERDIDKRRRAEIDGINKSITDLVKTMETVTELRKNLQARTEEDMRVARTVGEIERRIEDVLRADEDIKRSQRLLEESRKQDTKRLTDVQGEISSIRKRLDEIREKSDLNADNAKHLDLRINELLATEAERRQDMNSFLEQLNLTQVERDRAWKDWQVRFDTFSRQTNSLDSQLASLEETNKAAKRAQEMHEELNQRIERRINEITEMQRLAEDRFRQEWVTFKADDQKRWTNFSLTQEEVNRDLRQNIDKLNEHVTDLDDITQTHHDQLEQTTETSEKQMQELMNWAHEWLTNYERIMGHTRPGKK
jgi:hypothetical protein